MIISETERLRLRHFETNDLDDFHAICRDPDVMRFVGDGVPLTLDRTQNWLSMSLLNYERYGFGTYGLTLKDDDSDENGLPELLYAIEKN